MFLQPCKFSSLNSTWFIASERAFSLLISDREHVSFSKILDEVSNEHQQEMIPSILNNCPCDFVVLEN